MSKESAQKATFKDLMARKLQREEDKIKLEEIYIPSMDATMVFKKPSDDMLLDTADEQGDGESIRRIYEAYKKLIYNCCPMLHDPELHEKLEIVDPYDTVSTIFELRDVIAVGERLADFSKVEEKVEEIKN